MHIDYLPNELLQEIFLHVCQSEGDPAILKLGLVCHRWERLFRDDASFEDACTSAGSPPCTTGKRHQTSLNQRTT